ncbi:MAG: amino acid adenylation domain-containing protein, partial [Acidobacteriota bacterium]
ADGSHQVVASSIDLDVPLVDLSGLAPEARTAARQALLQAEADTAFDLPRGPLVRMHLVRHVADDYECVLTCHHLICDGVSFGVVLRDLAAIYSAACRGQQAVLEPATPFGEFAAWQAGQARLEGHKDDKAYWTTRFATAPPVLDLPADRPRPVALTYAGANATTTISPALVAGLRRAGQGSGNTLFCVLLTGFAVLLKYLTRQDEVVVGIVSSGQRLMGRESLVGHCANFLPLRIPTTSALDDSLRTTRGVLFDAFDHQNFTFGALVRTLSLRRDPGRLPLVSAMFNLDPKPEPLQFGAIRTFDSGVAKRHVNFDIHLNAVESDEGLRFDCGYLSDVYDAATVQRWLGYYTRILEAMAADLRQDIGQVTLIGPAERATLLREWNRTARDYPRDVTVDACVAAQVARTPDATAVIFGDQRLSYGELCRRADAVASLLRNAGVGRGALVGLAVERSADMVAALLGILRTGAAFVPIDPAYPVDRMTFVLEDSGAVLLLTHAHVLHAWRPPCPVLLLDDAVRGASHPSPPDASASGDDLAYVLYTSGSTGKPKGVEIEHRALVNLLEAMRHEPGLRRGDVWLAVTTISFDIAMLELLLPLITGATVVIAPREMTLDPARLQAEIARTATTVLQATPATWRLLIESGWPGADRLKALCGGEAMPSDLARALLPRCGELWNMYGPTETTIWSTCRRIVSDDIDIGHPIANTDVYVLDEALALAPTGSTGEIMIGGDGLARGYRHRSDLTADRFIPHPFRPGARLYRTGDLGRWRSSGALECLGRIDHQVKIRGFRVEPGEIESVLSLHPGVGACVVVAREDSPGNQHLVAYFETAGADVATSAELRAHVQRVLPPYMVPSFFVVLDHLPLTANGKIDRKALPALSPGRDAPVRAGDEDGTPSTALEIELLQIWKRVLGVGVIGVSDSFFELGGHSLLAIRLFGQIRDAIGLELPFGLILQHPTIRSLAPAIERLRQPAAAAMNRSLVVLRSGGSRPPIFFMHTVGGEIWGFTALTRHLGDDQPVYGLQAADVPDGMPLSVVAMAAKYVAEIRQVVPNGPYLLAGHCAGAATAFEMARQLTDAGQHVDLLAVLDYSFGKTREPRWTRRFSHFFMNLPLWIADDLSQVSLPTIAGRLKSRFRVLTGRLRARLRGGDDAEPDIRDTLGMWRFPTYQVAMLERYFAAFQSYEPKVYSGDVLVIRPRANPLFRGRQAEDLGWRQHVTGTVQVEVVRGSHETMLQEPLVGHVSKLLSEAVARVAPPTTKGWHERRAVRGWHERRVRHRRRATDDPAMRPLPGAQG